jgi:hypothetical protein
VPVRVCGVECAADPARGAATEAAHGDRDPARFGGKDQVAGPCTRALQRRPVELPHAVRSLGGGTRGAPRSARYAAPRLEKPTGTKPDALDAYVGSGRQAGAYENHTCPLEAKAYTRPLSSPTAINPPANRPNVL